MEANFDMENVREDEGKGVSYVQRKSRRKKKKRKWRIRILYFVLAFLAAVTAGGFYMVFSGRQQLIEKGKVSRPVLKPIKTKEIEVPTEIVDEDTLKYGGKKYRYNEEMINFLIIGVDTSGTSGLEQEPSIQGQRSAGQADTIFLAALNNKDKRITLIPVNRDTMTEISIYDVFGKYAGKQKEQIALSYAYGDGEQKSAQLTKEAVSRLFYGLPIHGYFAVNTTAIPIINDRVGGVEVSLLDDFTFVDASYEKGAEVLLKGAFAETYVRGRQGVGEGTNESRMARQQQYMMAFAARAMEAVKADLTLPVSIYQTIMDYMVTDVSANEVSYLATQAVQYSLSSDFIRGIPGTVDTTDVYAKFQADEKALYELILDVFYEKM